MPSATLRVVFVLDFQRPVGCHRNPGLRLGRVAGVGGSPRRRIEGEPRSTGFSEMALNFWLIIASVPRILGGLTSKRTTPSVADGIPTRGPLTKQLPENSLVSTSLSWKPQWPSRRVLCEHRIRQSTPDRCSQSTLQRPSEIVTKYLRNPGSYFVGIPSVGTSHRVPTG